MLVLVANAPILSGRVNCDPETFYIGLLEQWAPVVHSCFLDPAVALYTQPLGHLAAQDWLSGIIPWWTPYTGTGMPLAAEVQDEAFFLPFVLLLHFKSGWFIQRLLFQFFCGAFTYAFLRRIGLGTAAACFGGALFALNGTFYISPGSVSAPMMFLPLLMIGLHQAKLAAVAKQRGGWALIPLATAGGIYAGFPEVAFFNDLLALCWATLLLAQTPAPMRWPLLAKMALGAAIGLALTLPMVVPFFQYLHYGDIGIHSGETAKIVYPASAAPLQMLPLFYGAIAPFASAPLPVISLQWALVGGWFGCTPVLLALAAVFGTQGWVRQNRLRLLLCAWIVIWEARCFGLPVVTWFVNLLPGVGVANATRFIAPSLEFAVFTLAACGLDDIRRGFLLRGRGMWRTGSLFLLCLALSVLPAARDVGIWFRSEPLMLRIALVNAVAVAGSAVIVLFAMRFGKLVLTAAALVLGGAVIIFMIPELSGLRGTQLDRTGIDYLRQNAGLSRMFSVGPLSYNIPAQWNIASINAHQLPKPAPMGSILPN